MKFSNSPSPMLPAISRRDDHAVAPSAKKGNVGSSAVPAPATEKSKGKPALNGRSVEKTARAAKSKPAIKVRGRTMMRAAKNAPTPKSASKPSRKATVGFKQESVIALLRRPEGASIDALVKATGWQSHSVRGFLAGTVRKKLRLPLQSEKTDGRRTYRIKVGKPAAKTGKSRTV